MKATTCQENGGSTDRVGCWPNPWTRGTLCDLILNFKGLTGGVGVKAQRSARCGLDFQIKGSKAKLTVQQNALAGRKIVALLVVFKAICRTDRQKGEFVGWLTVKFMRELGISLLFEFLSKLSLERVYLGVFGCVESIGNL